MKKHIVCFGDSNTHGYCAETGGRFSEKERWTCLLQERNIWFWRKACPEEPAVFPILSMKGLTALIPSIPA